MSLLAEAEGGFHKGCSECDGFQYSCPSEISLEEACGNWTCETNGQKQLQCYSKKFAFLGFFFEIGGHMIPMSAFYAVFFALTTALLYVRTPTLEIMLLGTLITIKELVNSIPMLRCCNFFSEPENSFWEQSGNPV
jgi:hypothetical protein